MVLSRAKPQADGVPFFPQLTPIGLYYRELITHYNSKYEKPNSDLNFVSLWGYMYVKCEIAQLFDNLVVKLLDYHDQKPYFSFMGSNRIVDTVHTLIQYTQANKLEPYLRSIHEDIILHSESTELKNMFNIQRDPDYDDYVLDLATIPTLKGRRYSDRRREIHTFKHHYPAHSFKTLDLKNIHIQNQMLELFTLWEVQNSPKVNLMESEAFRRILSNQLELQLDGFGLYVEDKLVGFMICEPIDSTYIMSHYAKSNYFYNFAYTMLVYMTACYYAAKNYRSLNFQQDLGIDGLRKYKHLWRPSFFVKKYIISPHEL